MKLCDLPIVFRGCDRYEEEETDGTDSTVYSTAVALAIMGCFQVRRLVIVYRDPEGKQSAWHTGRRWRFV